MMMRRQMKMSCVMIGLMGLGLCGSAQAAMIAADDVSYTIDPTTPTWAAAPDTSDDMLADGQVANVKPAFTNEPGSSNADWVEFAPSAYASPKPDYVLLHFDLSQSQTLSKLKIIYYRSDTGNVRNPTDVKLSYSTDNVSFTTPATFTPFNGPDDTINTATVDLTTHPQARYVNVQIDLPAGGWTYLTELQFDAVPEPGSLAIGLTSVLGWVLLGRRRRYVTH